MPTWLTRHGDVRLYGRLLAQARPCWPHIAGIFLVDLLSSPLGLLAPLPLKIAVDSAIDGRPLPPQLIWALPDSLTGSRSGAIAIVAVLLIGLAVLKTEATIIDAMERLMGGRTTFIVAHRLSTLSNCQIRLEVEDGRVLTRRADGGVLIAAGEKPDAE